jgi:hypothetical protein
MGRHMPAVTVVATLILALACDKPQPLAPSVPHEPLFAQAPAEGKGGKQVIAVDETFPVECETGTITGHVVGWIQIRTLQGKVVGVNDINLLFTFTNAAGATSTWREVGADIFTIDEDGFLLHAFTGRIGEFGVIGRIVLNQDTGEFVFIAGKNVGNAFVNACDALT